MIISDRNVAGLISGEAYTLNQIGIFFNRTGRRVLGAQFMGISKNLYDISVTMTRADREKRAEQNKQDIIEQQEKQKERFAPKQVPQSIELGLPLEEDILYE